MAIFLVGRVSISLIWLENAFNALIMKYGVTCHEVSPLGAK
jgi:hypothetical protein